MTTEEKYKQALERAKLAIKECGNNKGRIAMIESIFPELSESEDERIRKEIHIYLDWLDGRKGYTPKGVYSIKDMIAWLEKQGQVKEFSISQHEIETCKENNDSLTSKDEEIRKWLIDWAKAVNWSEQFTITKEQVLDWLEKQKVADEEIIFRPAAGTDIRIAAKQALEKIEIGKKVVLAFNGAYIPVNGKTVAEIDSEYDAWLEKQGNEPNWCHHKVDLSDCSEEYRKAYYDGWNNCNQQHAQLEAQRKPAWSEEDEEELGIAIEYLQRAGQWDSATWIKSLKERLGGK